MAIDRDQIEKLVVESLRTVYDPEIPVNIHELGLIYGVSVDDAGAVTVLMTLTAPAARRRNRSRAKSKSGSAPC